MRNQLYMVPAGVRRDQDFALPVGFRGFGEVNEMPGTYGGVAPGGCGCGGGAASGLDAFIKGNPLLALVGAFALGYVLKSGKR